MAQYRKKPITIDAFRIGYDPIPDWFMDSVSKNESILKTDKEEYVPFGFDDTIFAEVETLEGTMRANHRDWIIKGINGELYPCKPDIFEATYEAVEE